MHTVTFLSDFGLGSGYVSQMKGVVSSFCSDVNMIDICHQLSPQDINAGAFVLATTIPYMPKGSIHIGVIDPGVGTSRRGIVVVTNKHIFIGPDNGLFLPAARMFGSYCVYEITNESLFQHPVSNTFHGRDIFASVAGHILQGISFNNVGDEIYDYVDLTFPKVTVTDGSVQTQVLFIDDFGNVITSIDGNRFSQFVSENEVVLVQRDEEKISALFTRSYGFASKDELLITIGSHGYVELSVNQGRADERLNVHRGDDIEILIQSEGFKKDD